MIYQEFGRILLILIPQPAIGIILLLLAVKILKRKRILMTYILSIFYFLLGLAMFVNIIYLLLTPSQLELLLYFLYYLTIYLIIFSFIFIVFFNIQLNQPEPTITIRRQIFYITIYGFGCFFLLLYPEGIKLGSSTDWIPIFSWGFLITAYTFFTIIIVIPTTFLLIKLYDKFQAKDLKKKFRYFMIGIIGMLITLYGTILYNTWQDPIFKAIWNVLVVILLIPSGILIFIGTGQKI